MKLDVSLSQKTQNPKVVSKLLEIIIKTLLPISNITRTAWAVFKYCGTKTVPLRMKKKIMKILIKNLYQKNNQKRGKN